MTTQHHVRERQPGRVYGAPEGPLVGIDDFAEAVFYVDPEVVAVTIGIDVDRPLFVGIATAPRALANNRRQFLRGHALTDFEFAFSVGVRPDPIEKAAPVSQRRPVVSLDQAGVELDHLAVAPRD